MNNITKREHRKLEKISDRLTIQSPFHESNIEEYFRIMIQAANEEFTEDNDPTLHGFLKDCFDRAIQKELKFPIDKLLGS
jgi:hypothetical protein